MTRTAVVTGAGHRVGRAIALALAGDGCDVVVHAHRSVDGARDTAREIVALGRTAWVEQADLGDPAALDAFAAKVGVIAGARGVDVLVNSAAGFEKLPFAHIDRARFHAMLGLALEAPFFLTQKLLPALDRSSARAGAVVVNVVDIAAERPVPGYAHYGAAKAGLAHLTKALAVELAPKIRVVGVAPGTVAFPPDFDPAARERIVKRIPLQREGSPDDVAQAVVFLANAPYVSGVIVPVDGGRSAGL